MNLIWTTFGTKLLLGLHEKRITFSEWTYCGGEKELYFAFSEWTSSSEVSNFDLIWTKKYHFDSVKGANLSNHQQRLLDQITKQVDASFLLEKSQNWLQQLKSKVKSSKCNKIMQWNKSGIIWLYIWSQNVNFFVELGQN